MDEQLPSVERDSRGRVTQLSSESEFRGPLGIWPWPILNMLMNRGSSKVEITKIHRDSNGRIDEIEEVKL